MRPVDLLASIWLVLFAIGWILFVLAAGGAMSLVFLTSSSLVANLVGLVGVVVTVAVAVGPVLLIGRCLK